MENENTKKIEELAEQIVNSNIDENPTEEEIKELEIPNEVIEEVKEELQEEPAPTDTRAVEQEKMLPQSQVNEIVAKARKEGRDSAMKEILSRYNVQNEDEFNVLYDKGTKYDDLNQQYLGQSQSYKEVVADNALLNSNFDKAKYESVKAILRGKGLDITPESIESIFPEYPEWHRKTQISPSQIQPQIQHAPQQPEQPQQQAATLRKLGNEVRNNNVEEDSEYNRAMKLYGFNKKGGR